jgi:hypothetical protein
MRTALTIGDDVLAAAKASAEHTDRTIGDVVSGLARASPPPKVGHRERNGAPLLAVRNPDAVVAPKVVNALRDERG